MESSEVKAMIKEKWLHGRAIIEVVGRPQEHVEAAITKIVDELAKEKGVKIIAKQIASVEKQQNEDNPAADSKLIKELWATFAELELLFENSDQITAFMFGYMPSSLEIIEPGQLNLSAIQFGNILNDTLFRLHQINKAVQELVSENGHLSKNMNKLFTNYVTVLLRAKKCTTDELAHATGTPVEAVQELLTSLITQGKVIQDGNTYKVPRESEKN